LSEESEEIKNQDAKRIAFLLGCKEHPPGINEVNPFLE